MISEKMVSKVKENADVLAGRLVNELLNREETKSYRKLNRNSLYERIFGVFNNLDAWLSGDKNKGEIRNHYSTLARKRFHEGIPLDELLMAFMLIKRHLWIYVQEQHFFDSTFVCNQALEFNNRVVLFFDKASYFSTKGYLEEIKKIRDYNKNKIYFKENEI